MKATNITQLPEKENATGNQSLAKEITTKRGFAQHWSVSVRTADNWLRMGLPHMKLSARQIRINIPDADRWMTEQFRVQRRGAA